MKLFYSPGACSLAPMIVMEWLGQDYELERVNLREKDEEFLRVNPMGAVPALQRDDGRVFTQVDAILQYLGEQDPDARLLGEDEDERLEMHMWLAFLTGDFHPAFGGYFRPKRFTTERGEQSVAAVKEGFANRIHTVTGVLEGMLGDDEHAILHRRTIVDPYIYAMARWLRGMDDALKDYPKLNGLLARLENDPGVQRALEREQA